MLNKAILLCCKAHDGQFDKGGMPYYLHPFFVALNVKTIEEKIVALLHDVVEDTNVTFEDLEKMGFSSKIVEAIKAITKNGESYEEYLCKVKENEIAKKVKMEDIKHNMDLSRLSVITDKDLKRVEKYKKALKYLSE